MSYENAELLRDKNGNPIPQYFNISTGKFEPVTGENGGTSTQLIGSIVEQLVFENYTVAAGSSVTIDVEFKKRYGSYFMVNLRWNTGDAPSDWAINTWGELPNTWQTSATVSSGDFNSSYESVRFETVALNHSVRIRNDDLVDRQIRNMAIVDFV